MNIHTKNGMCKRIYMSRYDLYIYMYIYIYIYIYIYVYINIYGKKLQGHDMCNLCISLFIKKALYIYICMYM